MVLFNGVCYMLYITITRKTYSKLQLKLLTCNLSRSGLSLEFEMVAFQCKPFIKYNSVLYKLHT